MQNKLEVNILCQLDIFSIIYFCYFCCTLIVTFVKLKCCFDFCSNAKYIKSLLIWVPADSVSTNILPLIFKSRNTTKTDLVKNWKSLEREGADKLRKKISAIPLTDIHFYSKIWTICINGKHAGSEACNDWNTTNWEWLQTGTKISLTW